MKVKGIIVFIIFCVAHHGFAQCRSVNLESITKYKALTIDSLYETDGLRNGDDYDGATLYYPAKTKRNLKSIVLVPGYRATQRSVSLWAKYLAQRGYIAMTIGTNELKDSPALRAKALIDGMETIRAENTRRSSPLFKKIDTENIAVGGWSMGGGGAQIAATMDSDIKALIAIAPWLYPRNLDASKLEHSVPVLILSGEVDPTAPPKTHSDVHYSYTPELTNKILFEIAEGDHGTPLFPATGNGDVGNIGFAWLQLYLNDNNCYREMLKSMALDQNKTASKFQINLN